MPIIPEAPPPFFDEDEDLFTPSYTCYTWPDHADVALKKASATGRATSDILVSPIMHFIWVGNLISTDLLQNIFKYVHAVRGSRSTYQIWLWTDRQMEVRRLCLSTYDVFSTTQTFLSGNTPEIVRGFQIKDINEIFAKIPTLPIADPTHRALFEILTREYADLRSAGVSTLSTTRRTLRNLGTWSDFVRILVLYFYGGIYNDCDNTFQTPRDPRMNRPPWAEIIFHGENDIIFCEQNGYGNSLLVAMIGCPTLLVILEEQLRRYNEMKHTRITSRQANDPLHDEQTRIRLKALQQIDAPLPTQYDMKRYTQIDPTMKGRMRFSSHRFAQTLALGPGVIDWLEESYPDLVKPFPRVQPFTSIQVGIGHAWFGGA